MIESNTSQHWYVLKTKAFYEKKVYANLEKKNFIVFLPLIDTIRQWSDRKKKIQVQLIPSVLFINCTQRELQLLYGEIGVIGVLKYLKKPALVKDFEIENLKILINEIKAGEISAKHETLSVGQMVEVIEGPFMGLMAESLVVNGKNRIKVKISVLNIECIVNIQSSNVRVINNKAA
jgi:transcription antitermination factor NusG